MYAIKHINLNQNNMKQYKKLKKKHEAIRTILMDHNFVEYGDCIIDEISEAAGILPTTVYYNENE